MSGLNVPSRTACPLSTAGSINSLSAGPRSRTWWALLNELASLLEAAHEPVTDLRDAAEGLERWPVTADTRALMGMIAETVEALDALGWQEICDRGPC